MSLIEDEDRFWKAMRNIQPLSVATPYFRSNELLGAEDRLRIYHDMHWYRQREALREDFESIAIALGEAQFRRLATDYLTSHPSEHPALEWLGRDFSTFLRDSKRYSAYADVAAFEWALCEVRLLPDTEVQSDLLTIVPDQFPNATFQFVEALRLLSLQTNPVQVRHWAKEHQLSPHAHSVKAGLPEPTHWLIWRTHFAPNYLQLSELESNLLRAMQQQRPVHQLVEIAAEHQHQLTVLLARCLRNGIIHRINYPATIP